MLLANLDIFAVKKKILAYILNRHEYRLTVFTLYPVVLIAGRNIFFFKCDYA